MPYVPNSAGQSLHMSCMGHVSHSETSGTTSLARQVRDKGYFDRRSKVFFVLDDVNSRGGGRGRNAPSGRPAVSWRLNSPKTAELSEWEI